MKTYFHAFAMCQSMFCSIPFPCNIWEENARDKMLLFLPVVGLEIGAIWAVLAWFCNVLNLPVLVKGLILSVYPYLVTGFIHLDGYMDVTDAVKSYRGLERRREILKDSRVGAFAVIGIAVLLIAQFAFMASAKENAEVRILVFVPAVIGIAVLQCIGSDGAETYDHQSVCRSDETKVSYRGSVVHDSPFYDCWIPVLRTIRLCSPGMPGGLWSCFAEGL